MGPILIVGHKCPGLRKPGGLENPASLRIFEKLSMNLSLSKSGNADLQNKFIGYSACENVPPPLLQMHDLSTLQPDIFPVALAAAPHFCSRPATGAHTKPLRSMTVSRKSGISNPFFGASHLDSELSHSCNGSFDS
jgi:hypothetical protein